MDPEASHRQRWIIAGLLLLGVVARLVPHLWNATPVMAIALFGATFLSKRWGILLPLTIIAVSDVLLGWHNTVAFTWSAFILTGTLAWWVRQQPSAPRIAIAAVAGSTLFFLITNFGVWLVGDLYPRTLDGLLECYLAGLPFFRNTLLGDLIYTAAFFGSYALLMSSRLVRQPAR